MSRTVSNREGLKEAVHQLYRTKTSDVCIQIIGTTWRIMTKKANTSLNFLLISLNPRLLRSLFSFSLTTGTSIACFSLDKCCVKTRDTRLGQFMWLLHLSHPLYTHVQLFSEHKSANEPWHEISNNVVCATSKSSDQPVAWIFYDY